MFEERASNSNHLFPESPPLVRLPPSVVGSGYHQSAGSIANHRDPQSCFPTKSSLLWLSSSSPNKKYTTTAATVFASNTSPVWIVSYWQWTAVLPPQSAVVSFTWCFFMVHTTSSTTISSRLPNLSQSPTMVIPAAQECNSETQSLLHNCMIFSHCFITSDKSTLRGVVV